MKSTLNITKFTDYRTYLIAHAQEMKKLKPDWSYGVWAKSLKLKSTSSITKIIQGQRDPGSKIENEFIKYFNFNEKQTNYFKDLIQLQKISGNPRLSLMLIEKMGKDFPDANLKTIDTKKFMAISNLYYLSLRELLRVKNIKETPEWLAEQFIVKVTPTEIKNAINIMLDLGLLIRDKNNHLSIAEGRLETTSDISSEAIKQYHEQMLDNAKLALRNTQPEARELTGTTLVMNSKNIKVAKELIREFRKKFEMLMEDESGDQVYQIQIQLFPITKLNPKEKKHEQLN